MVTSKVYVQEKRFEGLPKPEDFKLIEEELPPLKDGEFLAEALFLTVDPYMRTYSAFLPLGIPFLGQQVALIKESKNPEFPVGKYVIGSFGWRTHTVTNGKINLGLPLPTMVLPDFEGLSPSLALGVLGMPGNTAYFGFLEICQPRAGETVVVSGAAGAVGSTVGQIAKIKGCRVIGIAGSDEKLKWLKDDLGFDGVINYKTQNVEESLKVLVPDGVDCYFDNVGGELSVTVLSQMNQSGRVSLCGAISTYNNSSIKVSSNEFYIISKELKLEGFIVGRWLDRWMEGILQNLKWIKEGKIKYKETITEGFENMFEAFVDMLKGGNTGKAIVKV